jgi:hypothetical protein
LETYTLRPIEYFNLAALHSPSQYHLHSDFYDEDGTSMALRYDRSYPDGQTQIESLPAPTCEEVKDDLERLTDYAFTRWHVREDVIGELRKYSRAEVLSVMQRRVSAVDNKAIHGRAVEICAEAVGPIAADWIREQWKSKHSVPMFWALSQASAACLPLDEGLYRVIDALNHRRDSRFYDHASALAYFRSPRVLDWMETELTSPDAVIVESWGRLAAVSQLSWGRIERWLAGGRPLSLVALDGLTACFHYNTRLLRQFSPKLLSPPAEEVGFAALERYARTDPVPRVMSTVSTIKRRWNDLVARQI